MSIFYSKSCSYELFMGNMGRRRLFKWFIDERGFVHLTNFWIDC